MSDGTVRNDLTAGAQNYAPAPAAAHNLDGPEQPTITGLDGKTWESTRKRRPPRTLSDEFYALLAPLQSNALQLKKHQA